MSSSSFEKELRKSMHLNNLRISPSEVGFYRNSRDREFFMYYNNYIRLKLLWLGSLMLFNANCDRFLSRFATHCSAARQI